MIVDELNILISDFSVDRLTHFFRQKINSFKPEEEGYDYLFDDKEEINNNYLDIKKIGEADITNSDDILIITAKALASLTNRTGKKRQFEIAKKILKEEDKDASFFIFYDEKGQFRFSFIRANYLGTKREFTDYKRYTYFVSSEFTNKTFIKQISKADFNNLESIIEAFNVEPITKEFYENLQHWYFWAIDNVKFPDDAEKEKNGREIAVIRLITRLIFIWFMKVRGLIPTNLFDEEKITKILNEFGTENSNYYKAILQNLFFATLNTKQKDRRFLSEERGYKGFNVDYGNHNVFRYHNLFKESVSLTSLFEKIPFLNGGLFECLDYKTKEKEERKYVDGFTATKKQQPVVPDFLFFSEPEKVDLSKFYEKSKQSHIVEGLINLLNRYNFTIDENEPDDIEVALDPELLGSIFENLLASYNPETATTARKATGSFYTPREIVNYMTDESLKQYFITELKSENLSDIDGSLSSLITSNNLGNPFNEEITQKIVNLINALRVVDPAVGSGAFPMAVLNKLVFILSKLDPDNTFWQQSQIDGIKKSITDPVIQRKLIEHTKKQFAEKNADYGRKLYLIEKCIYGVDIQQIAVEIAKLRFFISLLVDEKIDFDKPQDNYGIEPLPNLDFKLMQGNSLISEFMGISFDDQDKGDQIDLNIKEKEQQLEVKKSERRKLSVDIVKILRNETIEENRIKNDLKEVNKSIIELEKELEQLENNKIKNSNERKINKTIIKELEQLKNEYLNVADKEEKQNLREKIDKKLIEIFEIKLHEHIPELKYIEKKYATFPDKEQRDKAIATEKQNLTKELGFDIIQIEKDLIAYTEGRKPKDFFLWKLYFAEVFSKKEGFDIVIGNPPYIQLQKAINEKLKFADLYKNENYKTFERTGDIYALFYEKGIDILNNVGLLCYITSNKWMRAKYGLGLRQFFLEKGSILKIVDFGDAPIFENATTYTNLLFLLKSKKTIKAKSYDLNDIYEENIPIKSLLLEAGEKHGIFCEDNFLILSEQEYNIKKKIDLIGTSLKEWEISIYRGVLTGYNEAFIIDGKTKDELIARDPKNAEIIKPILRGRDIKRYKSEFSDKWLINTHNGYFNKELKLKIPPIDIKNHPVIKEHLDKYWGKIKNRDDQGNTPYNLRNCAYQKEFEKEKIIWAEIVYDSAFHFEKNKYFIEATAFLLTGENLKYLLVMANSKLLTFSFKRFYSGGDLRGNTFRYKKEFLLKLPIPLINKKKQKPFEILVDKIIAKKEAGVDTESEEQQIDRMVYDLYDLTPEEIKIVEPRFGKNR